jgi:hypothetical protein
VAFKLKIPLIGITIASSSIVKALEAAAITEGTRVVALALQDATFGKVVADAIKAADASNSTGIAKLEDVGKAIGSDLLAVLVSKGLSTTVLNLEHLAILAAQTVFNDVVGEAKSVVVSVAHDLGIK